MGLMTALMIGGTATAAYGTYQQGQAAKAQAESEAAIHEYNAQLAEQRAEDERRAAAIEAEQFEAEGEKLLARQRVLYGKGGVMMAGTPLTVLEATAAELEQDEAYIRETGARRASYATSEAAAQRLYGSTAKTRGTYAARGATLAAGGTLLTGVSQSYYYGSRLKKPGQKWYQV